MKCYVEDDESVKPTINLMVFSDKSLHGNYAVDPNDKKITKVLLEHIGDDLSLDEVKMLATAHGWAVKTRIATEQEMKLFMWEG